MSIFSFKVAISYVVVGLILAVLGGTLIEKMHMDRYVEDFIKTARSVDIEAADLSIKDRLVYSKNQVQSTVKKVAPYIFIGVAIGAFIHNVIPEAWVQNILGNNNLFSVILATIIGIPMYADIFGTIPVAESLFAKGAGLGTVISFMMAVTALSLPSIIMLRKAIKPKLLALFVGIVTIGIIIIGYLFNFYSFIFA